MGRLKNISRRPGQERERVARGLSCTNHRSSTGSRCSKCLEDVLEDDVLHDDEL